MITQTMGSPIRRNGASYSINIKPKLDDVGYGYGSEGTVSDQKHENDHYDLYTIDR